MVLDTLIYAHNFAQERASEILVYTTDEQTFLNANHKPNPSSDARPNGITFEGENHPCVLADAL